ncbi:choice-of-anchor A family protein [Paenibacillus kobensis]|uniref:choice-of-anchor A family protein n=1 Tax=Paenibacillus kobensis TaxID=59841 RepID=UPI000FD812D5|nr:choice-of-anchor A family protein [Paenibacillus kobensis]
MACTNLGIANDFNVFVFGDHTQSFVDSEGRVAVGGNATYVSYGVGDKIPVSTTRPDLIVQGNINISQGTNFSGNTIIYPTGTVITYTMTNNNGVPGQPLVDSPIDFNAVQQQLAQLSLDMAAIQPNGTVTENFGQIVLTGNDPDVNIFTFNGNNVDGQGLRLDTANGINIVAPAGSTIVINVSGDNVGFGSYTIFRNGVTATPQDGAFILWNFYQAVTAFNQNLSIIGSVLAPYADWEAIGFGNINGTIVANSLTNVTGTLEAHNFPFLGCLPGFPFVPPTSTTTTTASTTSTTTTTTTTASTTSTTSTTATSSTAVPTTTTTTSVPTTTTTTSTTSSTTSTSSTTTPAVRGPLVTATKTPNVTTAQIGDTITYTIQLSNSGTVPAEAILAEVLPPNVVFVPSSLIVAGGRFSGVEITDQVVIGTLAVGQVVTIQFQVFIAGFPPNGQINNRGVVIAVPPGTIPATCTPGEISFPGLQGVTPVVGQMLPVLPVFKPGITPAPGQTPVQGPLTTSSGKILLNQSVTVPGITLPPIIGLTVPIMNGNVQPIVTTSIVTVPITPVKAFPSLQVSKTFFDVTLFVGQRITYSIFVVNDGNAVSVRTKLTDAFPANAVFIPGTVRVNNELRLNADPNQGISLGPIIPNQGAFVRFDLLVKGTGNLVNSCQVKGEFLQPNQQVSAQTFNSNTISNPVAAIRVSDFANFVKAADVQLIKVGESFTYSAIITNLSPDVTATNAIFYDNLDPQLQYISGSLIVDGVPQMDPQVGVPLGTIGPGTTRTLSFQVNVIAEPASSIILNQAAILFEFRFGASCFRAGLISNVVRVNVEEEEE